MRIIEDDCGTSFQLQVLMVINTCHGGFRLSQKAREHLIARKGWSIDEDGFLVGTKVNPFSRLPRFDKDLVRVVKDLGADASCEDSNLEVVEALCGVMIENDAGYESI